MAGPNLLIGNGQVLAGTITRDVSGSSSNIFPYTIERARERLGPGIEQIALALESLPQGAKPKTGKTGLSARATKEAAELVQEQESILNRKTLPSKRVRY